MGCGSSKSAVAVPIAANEAKKIKPEDAGESKLLQNQAISRTPIALPPKREPSQTIPLKIWVKNVETGLRTAIVLSGWDQDDATTVESIAKVLIAGHALRLHQLGFTGTALVLFDADGAVRPARQKITPDELIQCADMKSPLRIGLPPQWSPDIMHAQSTGQSITSPRSDIVLCSVKTPTVGSGSTISHSDKLVLSPRSRAYRAEVEAIAKRHSPQNKSPVYRPDEKFPDVIKRDMHSHLKKAETNEEPVLLPKPSEEEIQAIQKPKAVTCQTESVYQFEDARVKELAMQLVGFLKIYRDQDKAVLLKDLQAFLEPDSWEELNRQSKQTGGAWSGKGCIEWLRAYIDFAKHHGLGSTNGRLRLELRDETDPYYPGQIYHIPAAKKSYALIPAEWSLLRLRSLNGVGLSYLLDESEGYGTLSRWASGRFLDPLVSENWQGPAITRPSFGFCGQLPGISKQVIVCHPSLAPMPDNDRDKCFALCGSDDPCEYPLFEKLDLDAFLVQIRLGESAAVIDALKPLVVLDAAVFCKDGLQGDTDSGPYWQTMPGFGEGSVPGFTNSGRATMLIKSTQLAVSNLQELRLAGVTCTQLPAARR